MTSIAEIGVNQITNANTSRNGYKLLRIVKCSNLAPLKGMTEIGTVL